MPGDDFRGSAEDRRAQRRQSLVNPERGVRVSRPPQARSLAEKACGRGRCRRVAVFIDEADIPFGTVWPDYLQHELGRSSAVLVLIGPDWRGRPGEPDRLIEPEDWVRQEIETTVAGPSGRLLQDVGCAAFQLVATGKQRHRIEVALDSAVVADHAPRICKSNTPVDTDDACSTLSQQRQKLRVASCEADDRYAGRDSIEHLLNCFNDETSLKHNLSEKFFLFEKFWAGMQLETVFNRKQPFCFRS